MKKIVTLLLALLLSLSLTVPALAENLKNVTLSKPWTYDDPVNMSGKVTVAKDTAITFNNTLAVNFKGSLTVEDGASLTANDVMIFGFPSYLVIQSGATVTINKRLMAATQIEIAGRLESKGQCRVDVNDKRGIFFLLPGGEVDVMLDDEPQADGLVNKLLADNGAERIVTKIEKVEGGYHVTAHGHKFSNGTCTICDYKCTHQEWDGSYCPVCGKPAPTASILSDGNLWIVLAVAIVAAGTVIVLVVMKKKSEGK